MLFAGIDWQNDAFTVIIKKYFLSQRRSGTNFTAAVNCTNPNIKMQIEIIEIKIIEAQI